MEVLEKVKNRPNWTAKQERLAEKIAGGSFAEESRSAILQSVGYATTSATTRPSEIFTAKGVQNALISMGITPEKLLKPAVDALQANQTTAYQGEIYQSDVPDLTLRMKGADQIAEILGLKKQVIEQRTINVNVEFEDIDHLFGS